MPSSPAVVVLKFGGTSVSSSKRWQTIATLVRAYKEAKEVPVVVCSALGGVSNLLDRLLEDALHSEEAWRQTLETIAQCHQALGREMELPEGGESVVSEELSLLERLALGTSLTQVVTPKIKAQVMATGELMSTRLGARYLQMLGVKVVWRDARDWLQAVWDEHGSESRRFLSSECDFSKDEALIAAVQQDGVTLTQGFIAKTTQGDTVLLGRGGSDTSAAYFAAKLGAARLEIWTDVPGMFTANPHQVPSARLLRRLSYKEAQELATTGAKVLHPRCLEPVRQHDIPLHIRCTPHPQMEGTIITAQVPDFGAQVKAVSAKTGIPLVSMESVGMWQRVGFLADLFATFKAHGLSIDQVATSETNVTVSLDPVANALDKRALDLLQDDLQKQCQTTLIGPTAAISLVGHNIRALLHKLGSTLEVFEGRKIYLVSQAASDLNMTFVVDESQAERLVRQLHASLFGDRSSDELIGPTWRELFDSVTHPSKAPHPPTAKRRWWAARRDELLAMFNDHDGQPLYVYDAPTLAKTAQELRAITPVSRMHYAIKANDNPEVLRHIHAQGLHFECVSPGEIKHIQGLFPDLPASDILFTPNFAPIDELAWALQQGVQLTLDNLHPLRHHPEVFAGARLILRLDPGLGKGHHKHVRTGGRQSKFGVPPERLDLAADLVARAGATIRGLHVHVGSGIRDSETWSENALFLAQQAQAYFPGQIELLNLGGGLGVPEQRGEEPLDLGAVSASLEAFCAMHPDLALWMEPGRYVVAQAGVLLARVTQTKEKGEHAYVGLNTGMNSLIRPSLYGAFHEIVNLSRLDQPATMTADVVGPICESGDVLGFNRRLPKTQEGDVMLIATAGAYGHVMSSQYNRRAPAKEVMLPV